MTRAPVEREIDGIRLDGFTPGSVREVSPVIGSWLVAQGYALPEMRSDAHDDDHVYPTRPGGTHVVTERRQRGR